MNQERYNQIDALVEAALQMENSRRQPFLQRACGSDQDLFERVNSLLESHETAGDFLEKPAFEAWAADVARATSKPSLTGCDVGRYRVSSHLGSGGIGEVWLATDTELNREVALKFLSPVLAGDSGQTRRFRQEARAASSLNHPNLVAIFDIGEFKGQQFIAQEYVAGKTLRDALVAGPLSPEAAAEIAAQVAGGLRAAHAAGVVHRDIKPENIMIRPDGVVKVLDFGIARLVEDRTAATHKPLDELTRTGMILGTARYMSPEQARGLSVDGRSDIFSLGVVLYEMLTGAAPFSGATPSDVLAALLTQEPPLLSRNSRTVPAEFERVLRSCLAKDPLARYASADLLHEELKQLAIAPPKRAPSTGRWVVGGIAAILLVALAVGLFMKSRQPSATGFSSMQMTRLAMRGEVADVTISGDGKLLAYILGDGDKHSIWVRAIDGSNEHPIVSAANGELSGIMFSPDRSRIYYRRRGKDGVAELMRVPAQGGTPQRVVGDVSGAAALSPDGKRIAFVRLKPSLWEASLVVSNVDGSQETSIQTVRRPQFFDERGVAWSPDGQSIACFAGEFSLEPAAAFRLVEISLGHAGQRVISPELWRPRGLAWAAKGNVLIVTAATLGDQEQLWMVRHDSGQATRLTNDLGNYSGVSITDNGNSLVAVQSETAVSIWVSVGNAISRWVRIGAGTLPSSRIAVGWTQDGKVVYNDPADGVRDIWRMDADGANPRRLTSSPFNKDELVVTRDGHIIVYQQDPHIWRVNSDGTGARQLTYGRLDVHPEISPDGKSVVYASFADWTPGIGGEPTIWRVPIDGGEPTQISSQPASIPSMSPDGKRIACIHFPGKDPRLSDALLAVMNTDGSGGFTTFLDSPAPGTTLSWSLDGKAIDFVMNTNGVGNIWRQPIGGGPPIQITRFDRDELIHFAWSREGRLLCTRGSTSRNAVLIQNFR